MCRTREHWPGPAGRNGVRGQPAAHAGRKRCGSRCRGWRGLAETPADAGGSAKPRPDQPAGVVAVAAPGATASPPSAASAGSRGLDQPHRHGAEVVVAGASRAASLPPTAPARPAIRQAWPPRPVTLLHGRIVDRFHRPSGTQQERVAGRHARGRRWRRWSGLRGGCPAPVQLAAALGWPAPVRPVSAGVDQAPAPGCGHACAATCGRRGTSTAASRHVRLPVRHGASTKSDRRTTGGVHRCTVGAAVADERLVGLPDQVDRGRAVERGLFGEALSSVCRQPRKTRRHPHGRRRRRPAPAQNCRCCSEVTHASSLAGRPAVGQDHLISMASISCLLPGGRQQRLQRARQFSPKILQPGFVGFREGPPVDRMKSSRLPSTAGRTRPGRRPTTGRDASRQRNGTEDRSCAQAAFSAGQCCNKRGHRRAA